MGRKVFGGAIILASGVVLISGGEDRKLWAYDLDTGEVLWESERLPHEATSVPMTYMSRGRQYVVYNVAGHFTSSDRGALIYAYALKADTNTTPTASGANSLKSWARFG